MRTSRRDVGGPGSGQGDVQSVLETGVLMTKSIVLIAVGLAVLAVGAWWFVLSSPEKRSARDDAAAVSSAVAEYVAEHDELPRVSVSKIETDGGDTLWGEDFLVESRHVPRADPGVARGFYLLGDANRWCVEMDYFPTGFFLADTTVAWVAASGGGGQVKGVADGRCGEGYALPLSPVTQSDTPPPGTMVNPASAPLGTCLANPFDSETAVVVAEIEVKSCESAHFGEIFYAGRSDADTFGQYEEAAGESCYAAFPDYIGVPDNFSVLVEEPFTANETEWQAGQRGFSCVLFLGDGAYPLVGSARDSLR